MNLTDAVDYEFSEQDMSKPLKNITLSEADSTETFKFKPFEYERGAVTKTAKGVVNTIRDMQDLPEQVKIFGKRISLGFGGYFGDTKEDIKRKTLNLITAERNLNEAQAERYRFSSQKETESLAYGVGGGIVNYGTMLIPAGAVGGGLKAAGKTAQVVSKGAEAAGLGAMGVMELAGQVQDKTPTTPEGDIDIEAMTPEWARKATGGTIAYTGISAVTEKFVGFGQQMKMWSKPVKWGGNITSKSLTLLREAGKNALSEGMTEGIQDLEATGIGLIDGTLEMDKLPARLQQAWKSAIIGGIIGGGVGTAAAMKSARNVKKQLMEMVAPVVGEQDAPAVAEAIFDSGTDDMTSAISIELELSSELKNKHGKVWNSMLAAVSREMEGKPRFEGMTEDERAHLANVYAKGFADNLLAEANFRGTTLDAVLSASDITYDNGLRIARKINIFDAIKNPEMIPPEAKQKRESLLAFIKRSGGIQDIGGDVKNMGALKQYPGLVNKNGITLDDMALSAWENGYFPEFSERPDINTLLEAIDEGLRGNHRYNEEEAQTFSDVIENYKQELDREGIDWENMTAAEIEQAVDEIPEMKSLMREAEFYEQNDFDFEYAATGMNEDERESYLERIAMQMYQLADENAQLDAENPAYEGETININGQDKTVYNSNGDRIAKSKEALENFYKWFGDSKVVDEQGRPLVVYHGTNAGQNVVSSYYDIKIGQNFIDYGVVEEKTPQYVIIGGKKISALRADVLASQNQFVEKVTDKPIETFSKKYIGKNTGAKLSKLGFFFSELEDYTKPYGKVSIPVYLKINNPLMVNAEGKQVKSDEFYNEIKKQIKGQDGVIIHNILGSEEGREYIAFDPNQIKSTSNRGTYSESENIYYQSAFAGSRVDYDRPSLEAIGSGEGNQAHGWGLYYALNKDVAERYKDAFIRQERQSVFPNSPEELAIKTYLKNNKNKESTIKELSQIEKDEYKKFGTQDENVLAYTNAAQAQDYIRYVEEEKLEQQIKEIENSSKGQVHEVDIPENPYLLDEQEMLIDQSDYVQEKIEQANKELDLGIEDSGITGDRIYQKISDKLGSDKAASQYLEKLGIKGITYDGRQDGRCFVIFNPADVKVIQKFYQGAQSPKGMTTVTPDAYIIKLLEGADESTLPHELAHYWLSEMWNYVRSGRASEKYMQRWDNIAKYLNIRPEQTRLTQTQQEKFASSYEAYITRGNLPTPLIGSAFDDYDKWLQRVYNDYNKINYHVKRGNKVYSHPVRLTDAAVKFFQSMTTGILEAPTLAPKDTGVSLEEKPVEGKEITEPKNEIVDNPTTYDTTRVINITEGEKGVSKVFQREAMKHADRIVDELGVSYNKINLEEQAIKASEWVQNNLEEARKVIDGAAAPEGIIDTAIFIAYENEMLRIGNNAEYQRALKIHSQVQTQRGQAIAAERISTDDVYNPAYWWKKLQKSKETQVAQKLFKGDTEALNKLIESETKNIMKEIAGKPKEQQVEALTKLAEKLQKDYNLETLYQMPDDINERTVREFIKDTIGVNPDVMAGNEVINKAEQLQKLWENTKDKSGNPSVEAMRAKRELNDLIQAQTPSNVLAIWTSIFGRGVMLTSIKSPVLNIISNIEAGFTEGITRRLMYNTTEKAVDKSVKQEFSKYAWEVYKASADIVTTMNDYDDDMRIIGEQILHSQGQGRFRAASRAVEEVSFKYLMGAPDAVAKTLAFNDTADLLATKIAKEEGAKDISKRATEIYKDAILIRPETEQGQRVREQAQQQAHYTTFTNDSWAAKFGLSARNWLNMVGRNKVRLGDLSMKFVKTPANVSMMGLEYGFGSLYTLYHVQDIIKNPQSETSQIAIRAAVRNGLGIALAALLYSMLDPDDYFSEFDTLNPKEKDRMRALNAMPNSIKIGNRWVSLDYFGQLAIPLVGMLEAKRNNGLRSYIQSGFTQAAKIPGIKETKQLIDSMSEYARYDLPAEKIVQMMAGTVLDQARAMTIPAIVNDIAKMTDDYERDALGGVMDKFMASIPGLRQKLPERYGLQGIIRTEPALSTLFFGSRVKTGTEDKLVREVGKLSGKGEQPSISDVTKYGDLRLLSPEKKVRVRKEFYKQYNAETKKLISTRDYQNKSPEAKKKALNKVRSNIVKSLKQKYSNDIQREKRRR